MVFYSSRRRDETTKERRKGAWVWAVQFSSATIQYIRGHVSVCLAPGGSFPTQNRSTARPTGKVNREAGAHSPILTKLATSLDSSFSRYLKKDIPIHSKWPLSTKTPLTTSSGRPSVRFAHPHILNSSWNEEKEMEMEYRFEHVGGIF